MKRKAGGLRDWSIHRLLASIFALIVVISIVPVSLLDAWNTSALIRARSNDRMLITAQKTADRIAD
ncbi:MAG TPA: hypothetical protein V6C82_00760, partial [Chroococcales cyanobacterium]